MGAGETHTVRKHFGLEIGCLVVAGKHCKKIRAKAVVVLVSFPIITPVVGKRGEAKRVNFTYRWGRPKAHTGI